MTRRQIKYQREWQKKNPDKYSHTQWKRRLKICGRTPEMYDAVLAAQDERCAICKKKPESGKRGKLRPDHEHETMKARGLLCHHCNTGIGFLFDDPQLLEAAAAYLRKYGK